MSQTAPRAHCGRLFRRFRCDKSLAAAPLPNPGRTPGFLRDRMQAQVTFGSFRFEPATARLWDNETEVKLTRKAAHGARRPARAAGRAGVQAGTVRQRLARHGSQRRRAGHLHPGIAQGAWRRFEATPVYRDSPSARVPIRGDGGFDRSAAPAAPALASDTATIAVLPFTDMSPARDQDYLCEGLAEELIDALTHVRGPARCGAHFLVPVPWRPRSARSGTQAQRR